MPAQTYPTMFDKFFKQFYNQRKSLGKKDGREGLLSDFGRK